MTAIREGEEHVPMVGALKRSFHDGYRLGERDERERIIAALREQAVALDIHSTKGGHFADAATWLEREFAAKAT